MSSRERAGTSSHGGVESAVIFNFFDYLPRKTLYQIIRRLTVRAEERRVGTSERVRTEQIRAAVESEVTKK